MPWVKVYTHVLDDTAIAALSDQAWRLYVELTLIAGQCDRLGRLEEETGPLTEDLLCWRLRRPMEPLRESLDELHLIGLVLWDEDGCMYLPRFRDEQGRKTQAERRAAWRRQKKTQRGDGEKEKKPKTVPEAIKEFRKAAHRYPAASWWDEVKVTVGEDQKDLQRWHDLVHEWVGLGWNPTNVSGMLDAYRADRPLGRRGRQESEDNETVVIMEG